MRKFILLSPLPLWNHIKLYCFRQMSSENWLKTNFSIFENTNELWRGGSGSCQWEVRLGLKATPVGTWAGAWGASISPGSEHSLWLHPFWSKLNPIFLELQIQMDFLPSFWSWPSRSEHSSWKVGIKKLGDRQAPSRVAAVLLSASGLEGLWRGWWEGQQQREGKKTDCYRGSDLWSTWCPSVSTCALISQWASAWNRLWTMPPLCNMGGVMSGSQATCIRMKS